MNKKIQKLILLFALFLPVFVLIFSGCKGLPTCEYKSFGLCFELNEDPQENDLFEFTDDWMESYKTTCLEGDGTFSEDGCPDINIAGSCLNVTSQMPNMMGVILDYYYYAPKYNKEQVLRSCSEIHGKFEE